jgi:hypothetical protein
MKRIPTPRLAVTAFAAAIVLVACGGGGGYGGDAMPAAAPPETLAATLTADQETAGVDDSGAFGSATLTLDRATRTLSADVTLDGVTATAAHLHAGAAGSDGAVVVPLAVVGGKATLSGFALSAAQLASLDAGELYLNVHSATHAGGEIRGQVGREVFKARLSGAQETTPVATTATGSGTLVLNPLTRLLSGEVEVEGVAGTAAHIHAGAFGSNGGIVVTLEDHGGHGHFVVPANTVLTPAQAQSLRAGELYFNVHSAAHPGGELRGQIGRRVIVASATGAQEVPANGSAATGGGFVTFDPASRAVRGSFTVTGMTATLAHLHLGAAGVNGGVAVGLVESAPGSGTWTVPANTRLDADHAKALLGGGMYFNAHSATFAKGEIRGQLTAQ